MLRSTTKSFTLELPNRPPSRLLGFMGVTGMFPASPLGKFIPASPRGAGSLEPPQPVALAVEVEPFQSLSTIIKDVWEIFRHIEASCFLLAGVATAVREKEIVVVFIFGAVKS